jgi:hypothetical protein
MVTKLNNSPICNLSPNSQFTIHNSQFICIFAPMTDRHEKPKRVLDNAVRITAILGGIAILFAIWFSIQFAKSKTKKEFDSRQTYFNSIHQHFNKNWASNAYWDSVKLEKNRYKAVYNDKVYIFTYATRKESFNDQFNVQTNSTARPDLYKVLNTAIEKYNNTTDTTYVAQMATLCMNPLVLHKMTSTTVHAWGITHKSFFNNKSVITLKYDSYLDKQGIGDKVFPKDVLFEDQLPICLRALNFNDSTKFSVDVLESQLIDGIGTFKLYKAVVSMNAESIANTNVYKVLVKLDDAKSNVYYFEQTFPHQLIKFEKDNLVFERAAE